MAAITTTAIGAATAGFQIYQGIKQGNEAKKLMNEFDPQDLENVFKDLQISTVGSDLLREEAGRTSASLVDASRNAGVRGVFGAIPKIAAQNNSQNRQAQSYLDDQMQRREYAIAQDNQRIQGMQEQRDNAQLAGIGQLQQTSQQNVFSGIRGVANSAIYGAQNIDWNKKGSAVENGMTNTGFNPGDMTSMNGSFDAKYAAYQKQMLENQRLNSVING
jgi:hypothetical protein